MKYKSVGKGNRPIYGAELFGWNCDGTRRQDYPTGVEDATEGSQDEVVASRVPEAFIDNFVGGPSLALIDVIFCWSKQGF